MRGSKHLRSTTDPLQSDRKNFSQVERSCRLALPDARKGSLHAGEEEARSSREEGERNRGVGERKEREGRRGEQRGQRRREVSGAGWKELTSLLAPDERATRLHCEL